MGKTIIINKTPPILVNYKEALKDINEITVVTSEKYKDSFKGYKEVIAYKNIESDDSCLIDLLKENKELENLIAINEFDLEKIGKMRRMLNLSGQNEESAHAFRNKIKMKELVKDVVKVPQFKAIKDILDAYEFIKINGFPIVIKPIDGAASKDVSVLRSYDDLKEYFSRNTIGILEIEKYVEGEIYHIDGLYLDDGDFFSIPSKYVNNPLGYQKNKFLGSYIIKHPTPLEYKLNNTVKQILDVLPTPNHYIAFHAELFVTKNDEIYFCEIASRVGGVKVVETIEYATGVNILNEWIRAQAGEEVQIISSENKYFGWLVVPPQEGLVIGADYSNPPSYIKELTIKENLVGTYFKNASSSIDFIANIVVEGDSSEEVKNNITLANDWIIEKTKWEKELYE